MNRRKLFSILIALSLILITIPITINAALDEWAISEVDEDCFWSTYLFDDVDLVYLQGDDIQIRGWYLFEGPDVLKAGYPISEAYLSVMTTGTEIVDPDAHMTLYGVPTKKGGAQSYLDDLDQVNGPYTVNYVNVNLSSFVGNGVWHNITVTNIVKEINQAWYFYNGHAIAFVTLSPDNADAERYVASEESGHAAKLYVHYKTPEYGDPEFPPDLPEDTEWIEDYRNHTIWRLNETEGSGYPYEPMEYMLGLTQGPYYDTLQAIPSPTQIGTSTDTTHSSTPENRKLVRENNETIHAVWHKEWNGDPNIWAIYTARSIDNGTNWIDETKISTYAGMGTYPQVQADIAIDSNDNLHVTWFGKATGFTTETQIWYNKYDHEAGTWSGPVHIGNATGMATRIQISSTIIVDANDMPHIVWKGSSTALPQQIWITNYTGGWRTPVCVTNVSTHSGYGQGSPDLTVDSNNTLHLSWVGESDNQSDAQIWYSNYTGSWSAPEWISTNHDLWVQSTPVIIIDSRDNPHITWKGKGSTYPTNNGEWHNYHNGTIWLGPVSISSDYLDMDDYDQKAGSLAIDSYDDLHFIWTGQASGYNELTLWYNTFDNDTKAWIDPDVIREAGAYYPNLRWARYPEFKDAGNETWFITDSNGTIVWTGENGYTENDTEDIVDEIIEYPDPEDPEPSGWEEPVWWSIHRFKLLLFLIGMIMFVGSPVYGFAERPEAATWIIIMMNMLIGVALLWSLQTM